MQARLFAVVTALGLLGAIGGGPGADQARRHPVHQRPGRGDGRRLQGRLRVLPHEIAGQKVEYIIRDDATDASTGFTIAQKMISEDHVDAFIGPSLTATDAAVAPLANQAHVPMIAMAPYEYDPAEAALHLQRRAAAVADGGRGLQIPCSSTG